MILSLLFISLQGVIAPAAPPRAPRVQTADAEHVQILGTQVLLVAPGGFVAAERYSGLESPATGASVMVTEIPGPYAEIASAMTADNLKRSGVKVISSKEVEIAGRVGLLLEASQEAQGTTYFKWIACFGDEKRSIQLAANYPQGAAGAVRDALRACVIGAKWDRTIVVDPFAYLPFSVKVPAQLKFFARLQNALLFTRSGEANKDKPGEPAYSVTPSHSPAQIINLEEFAAARLRKLPPLDGLEIETSARLSVGRHEAWEIVATGKDSRSKHALVRYFVVLLDGEGYYAFVGDVGAELRTDYLPVFRKATASFVLKPAAK